MVFRDRSTGTTMLTRSTLAGAVGEPGGAHGRWSGEEIAREDGRARTLDAEGQVATFQRRHGSRR